MKRLLIIFLSTLLFFGCKGITNIILDVSYGTTINGHVLYYSEEFNELDSYAKIATYIRNNVEYNEKDDTYYIENPEETLRTKLGSCADFSILFMNIAYYSLGIKMDLVLTDIHSYMRNKSVNEGGIPNHAVIAYNDEVINVYSGNPVKFKVYYLYTFDEVFRKEEVWKLKRLRI